MGNVVAVIGLSIKRAHSTYIANEASLDPRVKMHIHPRVIVVTDGGPIPQLNGEVIVTHLAAYKVMMNKFVKRHQCTHLSLSRIDLDDPLLINAYMGLQQDI